MISFASTSAEPASHRRRPGLAARLDACARVLLDPEGFTSPREWWRAISHHYRALVPVDRLLLRLPRGEPGDVGRSLYSPDLSDDELRGYGYFTELGIGPRRMLQFGLSVWSKPKVVNGDFATYYESPDYQLGFAPKRIENGQGYMLATPPGAESPYTALGFFYEDRNAPEVSPASERRLQALLPEFRAAMMLGVGVLDADGAGPLMAAYGAERALVLCDGAGRVIAQTPLYAVTVGGPAVHPDDGGEVQAAVSHLARRLTAPISRRSGKTGAGTFALSPYVIRTRQGPLVLLACLVRRDSPSGLRVLVEVTRPTTDTFDSFATRLGLTPQEVEVARLMRGGYTRRQIADELRIGATTVRTHELKVMEKVLETVGASRSAANENARPRCIAVLAGVRGPWSDPGPELGGR